MNLAIRILYGLTRHDYNVELKEFVIKQNPEDIANICKNYNIVAFSCYIWNIEQTLAVCNLLKSKNPKIKILLGGPEVSYEYEKIIELDCIDYIIYGEGEYAFPVFLKAFPSVEAVPNLIFKDNKNIKINPQADIFHLDNFEKFNPYIFDSQENLKNKINYFETSRGCPYKCEFCLASLDNKVRMFPMETIKENLLYLMENGRIIKFLDRTFNIKKDRTIEIFQFILENHKPDNVFQFEITADIIHADIITYIQENIPAGLFRFEIGIQSTNSDVNQSVNRKQNFDKTKQIINILKPFVDMHLDLIVGLPNENVDGIKKGFEDVFKLYAPELQLGFLKFLKGTPIKTNYLEHEYQFKETAPYEIIRSKYLDENELNQIKKVENALEIYWNLNRAQNCLKYIAENYSIFDFLHILGKNFEELYKDKQYNLKNIYSTFFNAIDSHFNTDTIVQQMFLIDFYLYHKVAPYDIIPQFFDKKWQLEFLESKGFNIHKTRYKILPICFNWKIWTLKNVIVNSSEILIFQFNGTSAPQIYSFENILI